MIRNPHRNTWRGEPGLKGRRCACGFVAKNVREQVSHADFFEPKATRGPR